TKRVVTVGSARIPVYLYDMAGYALAVGFFEHEKRARLFVAGDQSPADQREADAVQVRRVHGKPEPLGEPVDEPLLLRRPDLDGAIRIRGVERMRERSLPRKGHRRAPELQHLPATEPTDADAAHQ